MRPREDAVAVRVAQDIDGKLIANGDDVASREPRIGKVRHHSSFIAKGGRFDKRARRPRAPKRTMNDEPYKAGGVHRSAFIVHRSSFQYSSRSAESSASTVTLPPPLNRPKRISSTSGSLILP